MSKQCPTCFGRGSISTGCPEGRPGCAVYHGQACPTCEGSGQIGVIPRAKTEPPIRNLNITSGSNIATNNYATPNSRSTKDE